MVWNAKCHQIDAIQIGEVCGFQNLISVGINAVNFTWHDIGNPESLSNARLFYKTDNQPNILEKSNEAIWFVGDKVIKFSADTEFISNRVIRAEYLEDFVPKILSSSSNMYSYSKVDGAVWSSAISAPLFKSFLSHCTQFWTRSKLTLRSKKISKNRV